MSVIVEERHPLLRLGVGWGGLACLRRGWGLNVYPGVGLQDEMPHGPWFVTIAFHHGDQMAPGAVEPMASGRRSSAGGETLKERARLS